MANYIGRFAPSPTGPLHMGSLLAAVISYLDAKKNHGQWLVRIEDIDPPRETPGASTLILDTLKAHGLQWDNTPQYQSDRSALYEQRLQQLLKSNYCYLCPCSRKDLTDNLGVHAAGCGKHFDTPQRFAEPAATRFRANHHPQHWNDIFRGDESAHCADDFVLKRKDGLYSYQLAVVSDDIDQGITHVLRGEDLLDSGPMQLMLYHALSQKPPIFGHFPLVINEQAQKLSKQNRAPAVSNTDALPNLIKVAGWLGLSTNNSSQDPQTFINELVTQWSRLSLRSKAHYSL